MILLSTEGFPGRVIGERVGVTAETVSKWRKRFEQFRVAGLTDAPRSGRPRSIDDDKVTEVINKTLHSKPKGATHWSTPPDGEGSRAQCHGHQPNLESLWVKAPPPGDL
ncbi:helix-turn-helix domain-containing protein [Marinobacter halodurans]|uniref:helix-turn-helix domain-containing protein n=1 Tax=Marinobacter halodurans TaxID=2528979 RepID=UPI001F60DD9A|nr:helix-turn-helix domain-containing protein [Marinobacter halodurans]